MQNLKSFSADSGGFWDTHPAFEDRIKNISQPTPP
jgi:Zn-dependent protease with chaperone function